jgi:hypothetical protein
MFLRVYSVYSILVNNRLYTPPNEGINWPLWPGFFKNLPSNGWFNYSNNGIKHYLIKENHRLYTQLTVGILNICLNLLEIIK